MTPSPPGAIFFKFILPHCRIRYASNVVIYNRQSDGKRVLQIRSVNAPGCFLLNTVAKLEVAMWVLDHKGRTTGEKLYTLKLAMDSFIIGLTAGTYTHVIDGESPLHEMTKDNCINMFKHMTFGLVGTESHTSMTCTSAKIYAAADVMFDKKFADFFTVVNGKAEVDATRLNVLADVPRAKSPNPGPTNNGLDVGGEGDAPAMLGLVERLLLQGGDAGASDVENGTTESEYFEKALHARISHDQPGFKRTESFAFV